MGEALANLMQAEFAAAKEADAAVFEDGDYSFELWESEVGTRSTAATD